MATESVINVDMVKSVVHRAIERSQGFQEDLRLITSSQKITKYRLAQILEEEPHTVLHWFSEKTLRLPQSQVSFLTVIFWADEIRSKEGKVTGK